MQYEFEFDDNKSRENARRHGISFETSVHLWAKSHVIIPAKKMGMEERWAIIGVIGGKHYMAIYTVRGERIRIISCHRADKRMTKIYEEKITETTN